MSNASPAASSSGRSEHVEAAVLANVEQERVPTAREQAEERRLDGVRGEVERRDVPMQVIDGNERQPSRPRERLGGGEADEQSADEARPLGHGDVREVVERRAGVAERFADHGQDELQMAARRHFGHDAAVARVEIRLRCDDVRAELPLGRDERRGGLVARRLDAENHRQPGSSDDQDQALSASLRAGSLHMITASSRLSV